MRNAVAIIMLFAFVISAEGSELGWHAIADEAVNPRLSAMGSAGAALSGGSFGFYNPASPAFADAPFVTVEYGELPGGMTRSLLETAWMFPSWFAGASLRVHSSDWVVTTEQSAGPRGQGSTFQSLQASLTGGFTRGRFASGHTLHYFSMHIHDQSYGAFTYAPGFVYRLLPDRLTLGASLMHYVRFDTAVSPWYRAPRAWYRSALAMPRYGRAGIAWSDTVSSMPVTVAADVVYSHVYERIMVPFGGEMWMTPALALRAGVNVNHPAEKFHAGVGLRWNSLRIDFDYGITRPPASGADIEPKWLLGLSYALRRPVKTEVREEEAVPVGAGLTKSEQDSLP